MIQHIYLRDTVNVISDPKEKNTLTYFGHLPFWLRSVKQKTSTQFRAFSTSEPMIEAMKKKMLKYATISSLRFLILNV